MDHEWERSIPFRPLSLTQATALLEAFRPAIRLHRLLPLTEGKRNTNYYAAASDGSYLLRIFPPKDNSWSKEHRLREQLADKVPMQRLYYIGRHDAIDNQVYAIYEYVSGQTLLEAMLSGFKPDKAFMDQLGSVLAAIHECNYQGIGFLNEHLELTAKLPPLASWYGLFLTDHTRQRLGTELTERVERLIQHNRPILDEMDKYSSLVHGDFRPTNLLVRDGRLVSILDWEFAMAGHGVSDAGQLFRYEEQFSDDLKAAFAQAYNSHAPRQLTVHWEQQGRLRDLANLLQMLGDSNELPAKFRDLILLIRQSICKLEQMP